LRVTRFGGVAEAEILGSPGSARPGLPKTPAPVTQPAEKIVEQIDRERVDVW